MRMRQVQKDYEAALQKRAEKYVSNIQDTIDFIHQELSHSLIATRIFPEDRIYVLKNVFGLETIIEANKQKEIKDLHLLVDRTTSVKDALLVMNQAKNPGDAFQRLSLSKKISIYKKGLVDDFTFMMNNSSIEEILNCFKEQNVAKSNESRKHADYIMQFCSSIPFTPVENVFDNLKRLIVSFKHMSVIYDVLKNHNDIYQFEKHVPIYDSKKDILIVDEKPIVEQYERRYIEKLDLVIDSIEFLLKDNRHLLIDNFCEFLVCHIPDGLDLSKQKERVRHISNQYDNPYLKHFIGLPAFEREKEDAQLLINNNNLGGLELSLMSDHHIVNYPFNMNKQFVKNVIDAEIWKCSFSQKNELLDLISNSENLPDTIDTQMENSANRMRFYVALSSYTGKQLKNVNKHFTHKLIETGQQNKIVESELIEKLEELLKDGVIEKQQYENLIPNKQHKVKMKTI